MRPSPFWDFTQRGLVVSNGRFGTTYRSHLQGLLATILLCERFQKTESLAVLLFLYPDSNYVCPDIRQARYEAAVYIKSVSRLQQLSLQLSKINTTKKEFLNRQKWQHWLQQRTNE